LSPILAASLSPISISTSASTISGTS
jgi:hypothetical protein